MNNENTLFELNEKTRKLLDHSEDFKILVEIAKSSEFEPFEGMEALKQIQRTQIKLKEKYDIFSTKVANLYETGKEYSEDKLKPLKEKSAEYLKEKTDSGGKWFSEDSKSWVKRFLGKTMETAKGISGKTMDTAQKLSINYIRNGFKILIRQNGEEWTVGIAGAELGREDIRSLEDVRKLSHAERRKLIAANYPHSSSLLKEHANQFDYVINLALGAVVTTNLPFTGALVCLVNMAKTLVRVANRTVLLSNLYGRKVHSEDSLYAVCAKVLKSLNDWESNPDHRPLSPEILDELYAPPENGVSFEEMMKQIIVKDHYIAIPFVGSVSLAKLNLDDLKIDACLESLFRDRFVPEELHAKHGSDVVDPLLAEFRRIFAEVRKSEVPELISANMKKDRKLSKNNPTFLPGADKESLDAYHSQISTEAVRLFNRKHSADSQPNFQ